MTRNWGNIKHSVIPVIIIILEYIIILNFGSEKMGGGRTRYSNILCISSDICTLHVMWIIAQFLFTFTLALRHRPHVTRTYVGLHTVLALSGKRRHFLISANCALYKGCILI